MMVCCPLLLVAQEEEADKKEGLAPDPSWLAEIVVTGQKHSIREKDLGTPLTIVTSEALETQHKGKHIAQILQESGFIVPGAYGNIGSTKSLFLQGGDSKYALILVDGVPIKDPSGTTNLNLFYPEDLARIEIAEGGHSTIYGSDAVGGVINLITKKATEDLSVHAGLMAGSHNTYKGNLHAGRGFSIMKIPVKAFFSYTTHFSGGLSEAEAPENHNGDAFERDSFWGHSMQGSLQTKPFKEVGINWQLGYTTYRADYDEAAFVDGEKVFAPRLFTSTTTIDYQYEKSSMKFVANLQNYGKVRGYAANDLEEGPSTVTSTLDLSIKHQLTERWHFLVGIDAREYKSFESPNRDVDTAVGTTTVSPYGLLSLHSWRDLHLTVGLRRVTYSDGENIATYHINPHYYINPNTKVFLSIASSYTTPDLVQKYNLDNFGRPEGTPNKRLDPEYANNLEGGIQLSTKVVGKRLRGVFSFFRRDVNNVITYRTDDNNGRLYPTNEGEQHDYGFRLSPNLSLTEAWQVSLHYRYVNGKGNFTDEGGNDRTRYNLIRRPKHSLTSTLHHQYKKLNSSFHLQWQGRRTDINEAIDLPAYVLINLRGNYELLDAKTGNLFAYMALNNLLNTDFVEAYGYNTWGFNVSLGLRYTY